VRKTHLAFVLVVLASIQLVTSQALAAETLTCWKTRVTNPFGKDAEVLRCRVEGDDGTSYRDYSEGVELPPLVEKVGADALGECWYRGTPPSRWQLVALYGDGSAEFWWDADPDAAGGPWIVVGALPACTSEPFDVETVVEIVWQVIEDFEFAVPDPELAPPAGVTGLATYLGEAPPQPVVESVVSPVTGATIDVEFAVGLVGADWGDGTTDELTPALFSQLTGYPDGSVTHVYETKAFYEVTVSYAWAVQWRVAGGPWQPVEIDPTSVTIDYEVDELVTRRTG